MANCVGCGAGVEPALDPCLEQPPTMEWLRAQYCDTCFIEVESVYAPDMPASREADPEC